MAGGTLDVHCSGLFVSMYVSLYVPTYQMRTYIVAMRPYFSRLSQFRQLLCVAAMSSLAQLWVRDGYWEAEAIQCEADWERKHQLLVVSTESLTSRQWLPGELLGGSEHQRPGWFLDMKYQTCFLLFVCLCMGTFIRTYVRTWYVSFAIHMCE